MKDNIKDKNIRLRLLLVELAKTEISDEDIINKAEELNKIYSGSFRHSYYELYQIIQELFNQADSQQPEGSLIQNLGKIQDHVRDQVAKGKNFKKLDANLFKLIDHLNIEISRVSFASEIENKQEETARKLSTTSKALDEKNDALERAEGKIRSVQAEQVAVLGIFAAIVFAFAGAFNCFGNALSAIPQIQYSKLMLFTLTACFVFFNAIYFMLFLIGRLIGRDILKQPTEETRSNANSSQKWQIVKLFVFEAIMLVFIVIGLFKYE